jgi:RNA polymerase sigma-70 factor (ECF subfamily)
VSILPRVSGTLVDVASRGAVSRGLAESAGESVASAFFGGDDEGAGVLAARRVIEVPAPCDRAALEAIYGELAPRIHRFLRDLLGDATLATDATQETFIRAFRKVAELPPGTRLPPWVFGIARHVSLEFRRARGRFRRVVVESPEAVDEDPHDEGARSPEAELLDREALAVVQRALDRLSEERRAALLLRLDHGLAYDDIAQLMSWSLAKVKVEIFRARETLRATLDEYRGGVT